ncbi:corrinoid protein [Clostridium estertheticum]|uniref:Corrinoid protein n=1 Tax=Clostridium estertheticum TaxID=238834 RepID=A0AA47ELA5_9CLOT|nr:corrinoid protein [Clostridium estertheticum]MBU3154562.1 corrinoid protein [Clostridium estertheticum]WAG62006.1 corrinoid protein [Clostridium estertheticum]
MSINKEELYKKLADTVVNMEEEETVEICEQVISENLDAYEAIVNGLSAGMDQAGKLFDEEEYFVPELLLCSDAMYAGLDVLKPHLKAKDNKDKQKVIIGVVEGDTHDIGKNLVKIMLETAGFDIVDLGRDVPPSVFVEKAKEEKAKIIVISTLMTTTMEGMSEVIDILNKENIRENFKVMIGGGPISQVYADKIGADGYSVNAAEAVKLAKRLVQA